MRVAPHSNCAFAFEVIIQDRHPQILALGTQRPPAHFHPYQSEYMEVLEGRLGLEIEGCDRILGPGDGQVRVEPWTSHRMFPPPLQEGSKEDGEHTGGTTRFILSGGETAELFRLDTVFFENWYRYQDEVVMGGGSMDLIQLLCVGCKFLPRLTLCTDGEIRHIY